MITQTIQRDFESWRAAARSLLARGVEPAAVLWDDTGGGALFGLAPAASDPQQSEVERGTDAAPHVGGLLPPVPRAFVDAARVATCHRDVARWGLLYRILWRLTHGGERRLLDISVDDDVSRLDAMHRAVRRDRHKMTAFVRFRRVEPASGFGNIPTARGNLAEEHYVAWHRPDHYIVRLTTPFFVRRFGAMRWSILTPDESVTWDGIEPRFGPGVPSSQAPQADVLEELWRTYYANIFNPARVNVRAMKRELPVRHWQTLPETDILPDLLKDAPRRVEEMVARQRRSSAPAAPGKTPARRVSPSRTSDADCPTATSAAEFVPPSRELPVLAKAAAGCRGCQLYCNATQVVFGDGPRGATLMFVGEQPGDQEDRAGKPFVGPAGQLLDEMLEKAGIPRGETYVTNAVKHFKFEPRGTRRIHAKPSAREVGACRPWLEAEIEAVRPRMIVCLGATAAQSLMGNTFRVTQSRGIPITDTKWAPWVMATVHPSALLRVPDPATRDEAYAAFLDDLKKVAKQHKLENNRGIA
jgi:DNA polymerase